MEQDRFALQDLPIDAAYWEAIPVALTLIDLDGVRIACNRAMEELTGRSREELLGVPVEASYPPAIREQVRHKLIDETIAQGYMRDFEVELKRPDGTALPIAINCGLIRDAHSQPKAIAYSAVDISAVRQREERLQQTLAAQENAMAVMDRLTQAMASGDLRPQAHENLDGLPAMTAQALEKVRRAMATMLQRCQDAACEVASISDQMARAAESLGSHGQQAASALDQMRAQIQQLVADARSIAEHMHNLETLAQESMQRINTGERIVGAAESSLETLRQGEASAMRMFTILDEVVRRTRLLSINAQVEAARVHNGGFGVIAVEMRRLSERAGATAQNVHDALEEASAGNGQALERVVRALEAFGQVATALRSIEKRIAAATQGTTHEAQALDQINAMVTTLSDSINHHATATEQNAAAAATLSHQAQQLMALVSQFRMDDKPE
jgi:methyl-accepting chemotaxis protein